MDFAFEGICAHPFKGGSCFNSRSRCKIFDIKGIRAPPPLRVVPVSFEEADAMMQYICNTSTHVQYIYTSAIHLLVTKPLHLFLNAPGNFKKTLYLFFNAPGNFDKAFAFFFNAPGNVEKNNSRLFFINGGATSATKK